MPPGIGTRSFVVTIPQAPALTEENRETVARVEPPQLQDHPHRA